MKTLATPYLTRRGEAYFIRISIPRGLRDAFQQTEIMMTLRTRDYTLARFRCSLAAGWLEGLFYQMSSGYVSLSSVQLERMVRQYFEKIRKATFSQQFFSPEDTPSERHDMLSHMQEDYASMREHHLTYPLGLKDRKAALELFSENRVTPLPNLDHEDVTFVGEGIREAEQEVQRLLVAKLSKGSADAQAPQGRFSIPLAFASQDEVAPKRATVESFIEYYAQYNHQKWKPKTALQVRAALALFHQYMKETLGCAEVWLDQVTMEHAIAYAQTLQCLPANMHKKKAYRGLTLKESISFREKTKQDKALDAVTASEQLSRVRSAFLGGLRIWVTC